MDLAKAKRVIIIMLIAFNFFLLFNNFSYMKSQGVQKETIESAVAILKARGVTLETKIPSCSKAAHWLVYGNGGLDREEVAAKLLGKSYVVSGDGFMTEDSGKKLSFLSDTVFLFTNDKPDLKVDVSNDENAKKAAGKYLKDRGLVSGSYVVDELARNQDGSLAVTYVEKIDGFFVYDNYCTVTVTAKGITRLEYGKLQIIEFSSKKAGEDLMDAYQVLLTHFKEGSPQVITNIDIGYKYRSQHSMNGVEFVELLPVWRVKIRGSSNPVYLNTFEAGGE